MPDNASPPDRSRPFPWRCAKCKEDAVFPQSVDYEATVKHDGRSYTFVVPDLEIPTCRHCGERTFTVGTGDRIAAALRQHLKLLPPSEIRRQRIALDLTQEELADQLGVAKESISRWETGAMIQSRLADNALRAYFGCPATRDFYATLQEPIPSEQREPHFRFHEVLVRIKANWADYRLN